MNSATVLFDSKEEEYFSWYLDELVKNHFARGWRRPQTISLASNVKAWSQKGKAKPKPSVILRDQTYTPDFEVFWTQKAIDKKLVTSLVHEESESLPESYSAPFSANTNSDLGPVSYLEVKGGFTEHDESRIYSILAKWTYQVHGIYIQRVNVSTAPNSIFAKTFCPARFLLTDKTMNPRKVRFTPRMINEL
jgi:hypothetical protein